MTNQTPESNPWLDGNPDQFLDFAANAEKGPVYMLNLLKFDQRTKDGTMSGAESYAKYGELARPFIDKHGGKVVFAGAPTQQLVGDMEYNWDLLAIVEWPARQNLIDLGEDPGYQAVAHHRKAGLKRAMLIAMDQLAGI